jgi:hypothetical protein
VRERETMRTRWMFTKLNAGLYWIH